MIEIEKMILRIPNITPEEGRQGSQQVTQRIADLLPTQNQSHNFKHLDLRIRLSENLSTSQLVEKISSTIVNRINGNHYANRRPELRGDNNVRSRTNGPNFLTDNNRSN